MTTQGNLLARYSILHELGRGAVGAVYAARDRRTGAVVALKRLDPAWLSKSDAGFAERFLKRARSARLLKHRNIVQIHDAGEVGGTVYVVMEMLEGESLRKILDAGPVPVARAIQIARDIAGGLAHAHLEGVVHGAIKPSNIIVLRSGAVKITDFGIGQAAGYVSPEQVRGEAVDHRCDLFSLGALLYEMLAHRPPFEGGAKETHQNLHAKPPPPSELNQHVPRALDAIVFSMLAADPAARMPGAPILLRELQRLEEGLGLGAGASAAIEEPTASAPPAAPAAEPRTPDAGLFQDGEPSAAEDFQDSERIPNREVFDFQKAMAMMERESRRKRSAGSRRAIFAALGLAVLGAGLAGLMYSVPKYSVPKASSPSVLPPVAEATKEAAPAPSAPPPPLPRAVVDGPAEQAEQEPLAAQPAPLPAAKARLVLAVSPQGEIYIDGKHHGTTPPITTLDLEPGMHRIEVRSGSRKPYLTYMTVQGGDVRRIRHDFSASRAVSPPKSASWQSSNR